jgi:NTP pyrophosphatase (non-canonical NTP hydrolase)
MALTLVEYAEVARSMAIYPSDRVYEYPSLGLGGEIGELCEKLDAREFKVRPVSDTDLRKEFGDVLWYVMNTALDAKIDIDELVPDCCSGLRAATFAEIQKAVPSSRPGILAGLGGKACELAKKYIRDDGVTMTDKRRDNVHLTLIQILLCLGGLCNLCGLSLEEAAQENLDKLQSRKDRGVLQGSGDNR